MSHMDTDLVCPTGLQLATDMGVTPVAGNDLPVGDGVAAVVRCDGHLFAVGVVPPDGGVHRAAVFPERSHNNGIVNTVHGMILQLGCQHCVSQIVFRHCQQPGGVLVDPVDDTGAQLSVDAGKGISHGIE